MRMCAHLEKRTVLSRVVSVGIALAMDEDTPVRLCACIYTCVFVYLFVSRETPFVETISRGCASHNGDLAIFPRSLCGRMTRKYPETSRGDEADIAEWSEERRHRRINARFMVIASG